jgi:predicted DNA-binding transcriptional regulator
LEIPVSKTPREFDLAFLESALKGKTLIVYWYLLQQPTHTVGIREVQRALGFSSPSIAVHPLKSCKI